MEDKLQLQEKTIKDSLAALRSRVPDPEKKVIDNLEKKVTRVIKFAPTFDYKRYPVNGVRAAINYFSNWLDYASDIHRTQEDVEKFIPILHLMSRWSSVLEEERLLYDDEGRFIRTEENRWKAREIVTRTVTEFDPKGFAAVHGEEYYLRCIPTLASGMRMSYRAMLCYLSDELSMFSCFFWLSLRDVALELSKVWHKTNDLDVCVGAIRSLDSWKMKVMGSIFNFFMSIGKPRVEVNEHIVEIRRKYNIEVDVEGVRLQSLKKPLERKATFSILKDESSKNHHGKVLFYMHGGAFIGPNYSFNNNYFTKDFCNQIPGLTVMNVKYSYAPEKPFPCALLEVLDCYLWLTSGDPQVEEILGFKPQDIIVAGDSSGGNLAVSLMVLLNEIRIMDKKFKAVFPSSLVLLYPAVNMDETLYPSGMMSCVDFLLGTYTCNTLVRAYIPVRYRDENGNKNLVDTKDIPADYLGRKDHELLKSPFISPIYYDKLQDLSHIAISLMAVEFDPILDASIQIAKEWKGPVDFFFVEEAYHGPLLVHNVSSAAKKAFDYFVEMTKKALERPIEME